MSLIPTHKGTALIAVMPEQIQSAFITADWEEKLVEIERGNFSSGAFIAEISEMVQELVQTYKVIEDAEVLMRPADEPSIRLKQIYGDRNRAIYFIN